MGKQISSTSAASIAANVFVSARIMQRWRLRINFDDIFKYKYKIALPAPSLYGQFKNIKSIQSVLSALLDLGFDDVFEVAKGADYRYTGH